MKKIDLYASEIYIKDLEKALKHVVKIEKLRRKKILITGGTGTIGSFIADMLILYNKISDAEISIYLAGRNTEKLKGQYSNVENVYVVPYDINRDIAFDTDVDYIIHAAGNAHPAAFNSDPVGTIVGSVNSVFNLLEYGRKHDVKRMLYVSSGEIYGQGNLNLSEFEEHYVGYVDIQSPRSCYPLGKRTAENLCTCYYKQYNLETVVVRPCHTYGPYITEQDNRANVQFIRNVLNGEDIIMKSSGEQMRSYNYVGDCASGLLTVLINGISGEAYNLANSDCRITIAGLAEMIAEISGKKVVLADPSKEDLNNRTPIAKQILSSNKIEQLGWTGAFTLEEGLRHTIDILKQIKG